MVVYAIIDPNKGLIIKKAKIDLELLQQEVGGNIEGLYMDSQITIYVNEEGRLIPLEKNEYVGDFLEKYLKDHPQSEDDLEVLLRVSSFGVYGNAVLISEDDDKYINLKIDPSKYFQ